MIKVYVLIAGLISIGCKDLELPEEMPQCVEERIKKFSRKEACETGARVSQYNFQGQNIYVFDPGNCGADMSALVLERECNALCNLGGFTGNVVCHGDTLYLKASNERVLWSN